MGEYSLPKAVTHQCIWLVRDMKRLLELEELSQYRHDDNEYVLYQAMDSIVTEAVAKKACITLEAIRHASERVPLPYRDGILDNIIERKDFDVCAHTNTWLKWKRVFLYTLAKNLCLI